MGLFSFLKKSPATKQASFDPYKNSSTNFIYHLLFCDNIDLYKSNQQAPYSYPFNILFDETSSIATLQTIIDDSTLEPRIKMLAYNRQLTLGHQPIRKLMAVIVEVGLDEGLDVLASYCDGTARYINHTESKLIWEQTTDEQANTFTDALFLISQDLVAKLGPWHKPRKPYPTKGNARITFLVSDGIYFGEGPIDVLFNDPMAAPAIQSATMLMQYLIEQSLEEAK